MVKNKRFFIYLVFFLFASWLFSYLGGESKLTNGFNNAIRSDGLGYYAWTQFFLQDQNLCFDNIRTRYDEYSPENAWVIKPITNSTCYMPIYPFGLGISLIPFYAIALLFTFQKDILIDPLSQNFQILISSSGLIFILMGLFFFLKIIKNYLLPYLKINANFIIIFLLLGSNLYHYATYDGIFSHASSFFMNSLLIFTFIKFIKQNFLSKIDSFLIGFLPLFGVTIRPTNFTFVLFTIFTLYLVVKLKNYKIFIYLIVGSLVGLTLIVFQLLIWKITTGSFFYFTYYDYEGFEFQLRNVFLIFFSFNPHGLLPWSPIIFLAIVGASKAYYFSKSLFFLSFIIFATNSIIFASWSQPFGGGAFGNRLFIDLYPLLFISIALAYSSKKFSNLLSLYSILSVLVTVHLTYQYWKGEIDFGGIPFDQYLDQISEIARFMVQ
jgi:hypothetical protein